MLDGLMAEHERRVNDDDLLAYQNMDANTMGAKIPGFKSEGDSR